MKNTISAESGSIETSEDDADTVAVCRTEASAYCLILRALGMEEEGDAVAEVERLVALVNNPQTADFLESIKAEAAHQVQRWGEAHDRSKSAENWFWLVGYLAGKSLRAVIVGDKEKALHHTISAGAALAHWHAAIMADTTHAGIGQDADLAAIAAAGNERTEGDAIDEIFTPGNGNKAKRRIATMRNEGANHG